MSISLARLLKFHALFGSLRNRIFNAVARLLTGRRTSVDWRDVRIVHPEGISIGHDFSCGKGLWLESVRGLGRLTIGDRVNFSDYVHVGCVSAVTIGHGVLVGSKVLISDHAHGAFDEAGPHQLELAPNAREITSKGDVVIGNDVWLGDGVCVLQGVTIGAAAVVGANAVVVRDIPPRTVWGGVPARQIWPPASAAPCLPTTHSS